MKIDGNQIKVGNILEINSKLWRVLKTQHTQPGKGGAYLQVEMKELKEGTKINERFRSSETVERAILDEREFQFLYKNNDDYYKNLDIKKIPFNKLEEINLYKDKIFILMLEFFSKDCLQTLYAISSLESYPIKNVGLAFSINCLYILLNFFQY